MRLLAPRLIVLLTAVGAITSRCSAQDSNVEKSDAYMYKAYDYVTNALDAMTLANSTNNETAYQRYLSDAAFAVTQGIKWCERGREAVVATSQEMKAMGCHRSYAEFTKASELILLATRELAQAESNFAQVAGAKNPYFIKRMYDEASALIASASRQLKLAAVEMEDGVIDTKECVP